MPESKIAVEVAYAKPGRQIVASVTLPFTSTVQDALDAVNIFELCPELNKENLTAGIFSKICSLDHPLKSGDRVEIYRPLVNDPKAIRRQKANKKW